MDNRIRAVFDTETTGTDFLEDRIVSAGILITKGDKVIDTFYKEINPDGKKSEYAAFAVHGLSDNYLATLPKFEHYYKDILDIFFKYNVTSIVIHNADFDTGMLSSELDRLRDKGIDVDGYIRETYPDFIPRKNRIYTYDEVKKEYTYTGTTIAESNDKTFTLIDLFNIEDTFLLANNFYPKKTSLDALSDHLGVDRSARSEYHGALVDVEILFKAYVKIKETLLAEKDFWEMQLDLKGYHFPSKLTVKPEDKLSPDLASQLIDLSATSSKLKNQTRNKLT